MRYSGIIFITQLLFFHFGCGKEKKDNKIDAGIGAGREKENSYIVGAHYYPWFDPEIEPSWGECETALQPLLGYYDTGSKEVPEQHIKWANHYGVDVLALVWWGREDGKDCIRPEEFCTRGERNLNTGFFQASNLSEIKFCIHYDVQNRLAPGWSFHYDFDDPFVYNTFVDDCVYMAEKYFSHPSYLKINDRPVIWILFALFFKGNFADAIQEVRDRIKSIGYDPYIVADAVWWEEPDISLIENFDAISSYSLYIPTLGGADVANTSEYADSLRELYAQWSEVVTKTKVRGREEHVDFQPGIIPRIWRDYMEHHPLFALPLESRDGFVKIAEMARELSEPALDTDLQFVWITSWNEWCERTSIEPTECTEPDYPFGNLGFELLEVIEEVFGRD